MNYKINSVLCSFIEKNIGKWVVKKITFSRARKTTHKDNKKYCYSFHDLEILFCFNLFGYFSFNLSMFKIIPS